MTQVTVLGMDWMSMTQVTVLGMDWVSMTQVTVLCRNGLDVHDTSYCSLYEWTGCP